MASCDFDLNDRRRKFWTTQPDACGTYDLCGLDGCGVAGLKLIEVGDAATIATDDYVRGLALNILLTDGRRMDTECGFAPGTRGGHWSDSYVRGGTRAGSTMRDIPTTYSVRETVGLVKAHIAQDLQKLVKYGVASSVDVEATYLGGNAISVVASIMGRSGSATRVGITGTRTANAWVWN